MADTGVNVATLNAVVTADTADFDSKIDSANQKTDSFASGTDRAATSAANFGGASLAMQAGAIGIEAGLVNAVMAAGDFQSSMNEIGAVSGASADQLSQLSDMALKVGQDTSFSAQQGAEAISELSKAGIGIPDILNGAAMATANLAAAAGEDMPTAATQMSNAMNTFQHQRRSGGKRGRYAGRRRERLIGRRVGPRAGSCAGRSIGIRARTLAARDGRPTGALQQLRHAGQRRRHVDEDDADEFDSRARRRKRNSQPRLSTADTANKFFDAQGNFVGMEQASRRSMRRWHR
jgi:hypothetical protein